MDACFTPQSKSAGKIRSFVMGVSMRIITVRTISLAKRILYGIQRKTSNEKTDWIMCRMGFCCKALEQI